MLALNDENKRLFGDQVGDHIEKLTDLLSLRPGAAIDETAVGKVCLSTRLLEGTARMLELDAWSGSLALFRELIEGAMTRNRCWDEHLSQIVSELVETEEQVVGGMLSGGIEPADCAVVFEGIRSETEILLGETPSGDDGDATIRFTPVPDEKNETKNGDAERFVTIDRLMDSLGSVRERFREHLDHPHGMDAVKNLELAFGESEFFLGLAGEIIRRIGDRDCPFVARVSSTTVLDGVQDFMRLHGKLHGWNAQLDTRSDYFSLERQFASELAVLLESCAFDICRRYENRDDLALAVTIEITREGSYLSCKIDDNGPDGMSDSEIDICDTLAFYPGLRKVRGIVGERGGLLWVEPDRGRTARFKFTFPFTDATVDFQIVAAGEREIAVPAVSVEAIVSLDGEQVERKNGRAWLSYAGTRMPVVGIDELAGGELVVGDGEDHVMVIGLAEKRVGILVRGVASRIEAVREQLTGEDWVSLTRRFLHIGEAEYPVLDPVLVFERVDRLEERNDSIEGSASIAEGGDVERVAEEVAIPRAFD